MSDENDADVIPTIARQDACGVEDDVQGHALDETAEIHGGERRPVIHVLGQILVTRGVDHMRDPDDFPDVQTAAADVVLGVAPQHDDALGRREQDRFGHPQGSCLDASRRHAAEIDQHLGPEIRHLDHEGSGRQAREGQTRQRCTRMNRASDDDVRPRQRRQGARQSQDAVSHHVHDPAPVVGVVGVATKPDEPDIVAHLRPRQPQEGIDVFLPEAIMAEARREYGGLVALPDERAAKLERACRRSIEGFGVVVEDPDVHAANVPRVEIDDVLRVSRDDLHRASHDVNQNFEDGGPSAVARCHRPWGHGRARADSLDRAALRVATERER